MIETLCQLMKKIILFIQKANESQLSSDEGLNEDSGSDFGSEDDPDKLWSDIISIYLIFDSLFLN
jgi:hypothetical protein